MSSQVDHVLVAGGGIGGLTAAIALRTVGIEVTVVERAAEFAAAGAGMMVTPNGVKALAAAGDGLADDVRAAGAPFTPDQVSYFLTAGGKVLSTATLGGGDQRWQAPTVPILRSRLQDVLLRHAGKRGVRIRTGAAVTAYTDDGGDSVAMRLDDGGAVEGDLLVGADGVRSTVRRQLLGDGDPRYAGYTAVLGTGPAPARFPNGFLAYGRGLILFAAPLGDGTLYWTAAVKAAQHAWPAKENRTVQRDLLALLTGDRWHPDLVDMVSASDPSAYVVTDVADRDPVGSWARGRVVLLGDAAHPMLQTLGQGANTAIEDAVVLAHHLARHLDTGGTREGALGAYTAERAPRTAKVVKQSRMMGTIGMAHTPIAAWARDRMMTVMGKVGDPEKQNADLFGWNPEPLRSAG